MALLKAAAHHLDMVLNTYATDSWMIALSSLSHSVDSLLPSPQPLYLRRKSCYRTSVPTSFMTASDTLVPRRSKNAREDRSRENFPIELLCVSLMLKHFQHSALYFHRYLPIIIHYELLFINSRSNWYQHVLRNVCFQSIRNFHCKMKNFWKIRYKVLMS